MKDLRNLLDDLETARDELKLNAHLLKAELKDKWNDLEKKWEKISIEVKPKLEAAKDAGENITEAHKLLLSELKEGYDKIKNAR